MARIKAAQGKEKEAYELYRGLVHRYPLSLLSRSGFYWLYKYQNSKKNLTRSHHYLTRLLKFRNLYPTHRNAFLALEKDLESRMNINEMARLRKYSETGGSDFPYFIGKVLENDLRDYDRAIKQYEKFLQTSPSIRRSREIMTKIADLYEEKGDFVKAVGYLDMLLDTYKPQPQNFDLIFRIGNLVEDKIGNPELSNLFYSSIVADYARVPKVRRYAEAKLKRFEEKKRQAARKPRTKRKIVRVYTEDDEAVIEELEAIIERQIDDLQDFKKAEREMIDLWDENKESLATLDIMKTLVDINLTQLMDPQKAAEFYEKWLEENPDDPLVTEYTLKLYDHYMEVLRDGEKALRLLENFIREHPVSVDTIAMELKLAKANEILIRNFDEARRIYQRIIDTKQNDPIVHEAYFRMGFVLRDGYAYYEEAVKLWQELIDLYYQNEFADKAQFAIGFTYETYQRDYTKARQAYEKILNLFPNSTLQNQARDALLRIEGK
jgi:tetratricopeptide (TPR) repeat protein